MTRASARGHGRLAARRRAADQHEPHAALHQVRRRHREQCSGGLRRGRVVGDAQARDLGADERPVRDVEVLERRRPAVAGAIPIAVEETAREIAAAEPLEIHREERDVGEHVAEAEPVVELEAVEDTRTVGEAEHVVGEEVAVPVADPPGRDRDPRTARHGPRR